MESRKLEVKAKRLVCPASGLDFAGSVSISDDRIERVTESSHQVGDGCLSGDLLLPGLIDLHCHIGPKESIYGVDSNVILKSGTTTAASQGDAGASTIDHYARAIRESGPLNVKMAINLSTVGESTVAACFSNASWIDVGACIDAIDRHRDFVWAIAVNSSHLACPDLDPRDVVNAALQVASQTNLPLLYGMRRGEDWPLDEQLALLREGDVVTYCFRKSPHCIVDGNKVQQCILDARARGILFDVGHGCGSFDFGVAEVAIAEGFPPDTISTDLQTRHIQSGANHSLPLVMSKLLAAGMQESDVIKAVTQNPAAILGLTNRGRLSATCIADLTVLTESDTKCELLDTNGNKRYSKVWSTSDVFVGGKPVA